MEISNLILLISVTKTSKESTHYLNVNITFNIIMAKGLQGHNIVFGLKRQI